MGTRTTTRSIPAVTRAVRSDAACRSPAAAGLLAHRIGRAGPPGPGRWGRTRSHAEPASLCVASSNSHMHCTAWPKAQSKAGRCLSACTFDFFRKKNACTCTFSDAADVRTVLVQLSPATRSVRRPGGWRQHEPLFPAAPRRAHGTSSILGHGWPGRCHLFRRTAWEFRSPPPVGTEHRGSGRGPSQPTGVHTGCFSFIFTGKAAADDPFWNPFNTMSFCVASFGPSTLHAPFLFFSFLLLR